MTRPPLRQVAVRAGVSEPTVSRVLNGRTGVAADTRERVLRAIADLGYDRSVARDRPHTGVVGMVTPELDNPIFAALVHAIDGRLARHGYTVQVGMATTDTVSEQRQVEVLLDRHVDGLVLIAGMHADTHAGLELYESLVDKRVPFVLVNGRETTMDVPHVLADEAHATTRSVAHLVKLGHRRIGCVLGPGRYVPSARMRSAFVLAMQSYGLVPEPIHIVETMFTVEGGHAGAVQLLENGATAIITGNDLMALGAIRAARALGLGVPDHVSVIGYDGTPFTAFVDPPLTTSRQPVDVMGEVAADALASEIDGTHRFRRVFPFAPELVARSSTGPVAALATSTRTV